MAIPTVSQKKKRKSPAVKTFECVACNKTSLPVTARHGQLMTKTDPPENTDWCISCWHQENARSVAEDMVPGSLYRRVRLVRSMLPPSEWPKHGYPTRNPSVPLFAVAAPTVAPQPVAVAPAPPPVKPKPNLIMPVSPMFASIMIPMAKRLIKKLCKVKNMNGATGDHINITMETNWNQGVGNENLEQRSLDIGTIGMVVGVADPATDLRFLVTSTKNPGLDGIYHVSVLNLEPMNSPENEDQNE